MAAAVLPFIPMESGDRLTRAEFHRRYCSRPDITNAELIEGVVYVASPTRFDWHAEPHLAVSSWIGAYVARTPGVRGGDNGTVYVDADYEVQPDAAAETNRRNRASAALDLQGKTGSITEAPPSPLAAASSPSRRVG